MTENVEVTITATFITFDFRSFIYVFLLASFSPHFLCYVNMSECAVFRMFYILSSLFVDQFSTAGLKAISQIVCKITMNSM